MLKEDSKVAVWMANEVNAYNSAINLTFRRTAIAKNGNSLRLKRLISFVTNSLWIPCQLPTKKQRITRKFAAKVQPRNTIISHNIT